MEESIPAGSEPLVDTVTFPDGSTYHFTYEPTPGNPSATTGRIASVKLPTGGTISYAYPGSNDGVNCVNGTALNLTRTTPDGTWTYNRTVSGTSSTTTATDPQGNQTVINFQGGVETQRKIYQGSVTSGTLLQTITSCYNGNKTNCSTASVSLPISETTLFLQFSNGEENERDTLWNTPSSQPTEVDEYDFGSNGPGSLLRKTLITYPSLGNNIMDKPASVTVQDGGGHQVAQTVFGYDETTPAATSGVVNHVGVSGSRGNVTTTKEWVSGSTYVTTTNAYNDLGNLLTTTDQGGHVAAFDYTDNFSDGTNRNTQAFATKTTYQQTFNALVGGYVNHVVHQSFYWPSPLPYQATDQNSQVTTYTYDSSGRPLTVGYPDGGQTTYSYPNPQQIRVQKKIDANNSTDSWAEVDGLGRASRTAIANGEIEPFDQVDTCYDAVHQTVSTSSPYQGSGIASGPNGTKQCSSNASDVTAYDALGRVISVTHPDTNTVLNSYSGRAVKIQDEGNGSTRITRVYQMDGLGRTVTVCEEASSIFASMMVLCGLDIDGNVNGVTTSYAYDPLGNVTTITQGALAQRQLTYDGLGNLLSEYIPETKGNTSYTYNSEGLLATRTRYSANQPASCLGPPNTCTTTTTTYSYDELHRFRTASYSDTSLENTPFLVHFYDQPNPYGLSTSAFSVGRLVAAWTETHSWTGIQGALFGYDQIGREDIEGETLINVCCSPNYIVNYGYNLGGLMTSSTNSQGATFNYTYNLSGRPTQMTSSLNDTNHPGTLVSNLHYGPFGLVSGQLGNGVTESYGYSKRGQMQSFFSKPYSLNLTLVPDENITGANDTLTRLQISSSMLSESGLSGYDQTQITDGDVSTNGWHTDTAGPGAWLQVDLGSGNAQAVTEVRAYTTAPPYNGTYNIQYSDDAVNWPTALSGFAPGQQGWNSSQSWSVGAHRYWRLYLTNTPGSGSWLTELELIASSTGVNGSWTYSYDALNRIATANQTGGSNLSFDIDRNSNRWHQNPNGAQLAFDQSSNQIASGSGVSYDALGNIINDGVHSYTYDAEGRLTQVDGGTTATYTYDALGRRTRRAVSSGTYDDIYDLNGNMITEAGSGHWYRGEVYLSGHLATYWNATTYFPLTDWLGSERARTDVNGNVAGSCTGNPYGDNYSCTGTDPSPIKYAGMEYDSETHLNHAQFRYYNPSFGLWMNPDPAGMDAAHLDDPQSLNRYAYTANNPLNATDRSGLDGFGGGSGGPGDPGDPGCGFLDDCPIGPPFVGGFGGVGLGPVGLVNWQGMPIPISIFPASLGGLSGLGILPGEVSGLPPGLSLPGPIEMFLADLPWNRACGSPWIFDGCGLTSGLVSQQPAPMDFPPEFEPSLQDRFGMAFTDCLKNALAPKRAATNAVPFIIGAPVPKAALGIPRYPGSSFFTSLIRGFWFKLFGPSSPMPVRIMGTTSAAGAVGRVSNVAGQLLTVINLTQAIGCTIRDTFRR